MSGNGSYAIEVEGLSFSHHTRRSTVPVLSGCSFHVELSEMVAISGPSGSGKTTLLHCIAGLLQPDAGTIRIGGRPTSDMNADALADLRRTELGMVFQAYHLLPNLTALKNVVLPLLLAGHRPKDATTRARSALAAVGLEHREEHHPDELSGGEQQRVGFARAIVHGPRVLLADEPTGNLDEGSTLDLMQLLDRLRRKFELTVVVATHDPLVAERCTRRASMTKRPD